MCLHITSPSSYPVAGWWVCSKAWESDNNVSLSCWKNVNEENPFDFRFTFNRQLEREAWGRFLSQIWLFLSSFSQRCRDFVILLPFSSQFNFFSILILPWWQHYFIGGGSDVDNNNGQSVAKVVFALEAKEVMAKLVQCSITMMMIIFLVEKKRNNNYRTRI